MRTHTAIIIFISLIAGIVYLIVNGTPILQQTIFKPPPPIHIPSSILVTTTPERLEEAVIKEVIDGDTVELTNGKKVRYIGVDTPETKHPRKGVECFGKEASEFNTRLVKGKKVLLGKDVSETDRYKRLLRFVYLPHPTATGEVLFVNKYLVDEGYAHASTFPPDVKFSSLFREAEQKAREKQKGLWKECEQ